MSDLKALYTARRENALVPVAKRLEAHLQELLGSTPRIDRVAARAKSVDRFLAKAEKAIGEQSKYEEPLSQIQDQIGARITTFYLSDIEAVCGLVERYLRPIESKEMIPESEWEFGYFGQHYVMFIPDEAIGNDIDRNHLPDFFELQIKTLFQHAWSEAHHDLGYKPTMGELTSGEKRKLAFTSAQAWGADNTFDELYRRLVAKPQQEKAQ